MRVVDEQVNHIGTVHDIIGPVENPYIIIKLNKDIKNLKELPGKLLYTYSKKMR